MSGSKKVIVLGLDGLDPYLVEAWREYLPTLDKLMESGVYGKLKSTVPPNTVPAWASFYTGKNPGKFGVFSFRERAENRYGWKYNSRKDVDSLAIWDYVGQAGKKSIVLNVPLTYPPQQINGIMVTGILTPSSLSSYTYPKSIKRELNEVCNYDMLIDTEKNLSEKTVEKYVSRRIEILTKALFYLMKNYSWDLFITVYNATDMVSHFCMKQTPEESKAVRKVYEKMDKIISLIHRSFVRDSNNIYLIIMSDHGFGPIEGVFHTNNWLEEEGYLVRKSGKPRAISAEKIARIAEKLHMSRLLSIISKEKVSRLMPLESNDIFSGTVDWSKTLAYCTDMGMIYINEKGREPKGIVDSEEKDGLAKEIIYKLKRLKIVDSVYAKEEVYTGPYLGRAPDIIFSTLENRLNPSAYFGDSIIGEHGKWSGAHRQYGFYLISGPDINSARYDAKIMDITPTILTLMGIKLPSDLDGLPILRD